MMPTTICRNRVRLSTTPKPIEYDVPVRFVRVEQCADVALHGPLGPVRQRWIYQTIGIVPAETFFTYEPLPAWE